MQINSLGVCRASEKIYEKLQVTGVGADERVAPVFDPEINPAPFLAQLYKLDEPGDEYVAVVPDLPQKSAEYVLGAYDTEGNLTQTASHCIDFEQAKWQSRINYRLHKDMCAQIRCFDERQDKTPYGDRSIVLRQVIGAADHQIMRVAVTMPDLDANNLELLFVNGRCEKIVCRPVPMGLVSDEPMAPGLPRDVTATFSVNIPWNQGDLHVAAWDKARPAHMVEALIPTGEQDRLRGEMDRLLYNDASSDGYYPEWLRIHRPTPYTLDQQRAASAGAALKFSIVTPLYKTPVALFDEMLASVEAQTYENWELVLVNASPEDEPLRERIAEACAFDQRVVCVELAENEGISENTAAGVARAAGDYVCYLDHDDTIEPDALYEYASAVAKHGAELIYSDEDVLKEDGSFSLPFFKPDFDIDLLRSTNYMTHFLCVKRALLSELPGNSPEFDGAQDHNLILQATEHTDRVWHVRKILYHWRSCEGSSQADPESKRYAVDAGIKALGEHLARTGEKAEVEPGPYLFTYRVRYDVPSPAPLASIIIPSYDHVDILRTCVDSILRKTTYPNYEVVVIENNSKKPETFAYYKELEASHGDRVRVEYWPAEFNFSKIVNFGAEKARGEYLVLLNNDTELITPDWLQVLVGNCARPKVGCTGALLFYPDDTIQHAGVNTAGLAAHLFKDLPRARDGYFHLGGLQRQLSAVTAACMAVRRDAWEAVGGFEESLSVAYNDVDFCLKLRDAGYYVVYAPDVQLYHYESLSRGFDEETEAFVRVRSEQIHLQERWPRHFALGDPFFTPHLRSEFPLNSYYVF